MPTAGGVRTARRCLLFILHPRREENQPALPRAGPHPTPQSQERVPPGCSPGGAEAGGGHPAWVTGPAGSWRGGNGAEVYLTASQLALGPSCPGARPRAWHTIHGFSVCQPGGRGQRARDTQEVVPWSDYHGHPSRPPGRRCPGLHVFLHPSHSPGLHRPGGGGGHRDPREAGSPRAAGIPGGGRGSSQGEPGMPRGCFRPRAPCPPESTTILIPTPASGHHAPPGHNPGKTDPQPCSAPPPGPGRLGAQRGQVGLRG